MIFGDNPLIDDVNWVADTSTSHIPAPGLWTLPCQHARGQINQIQNRVLNHISTGLRDLTLSDHYLSNS